MEDMSLLSTGYIPSTNEVLLINARITEQQQELQSLDLKIVSLEKELRRLRRHQRRVRRSCSIAQSMIAPIRRLPLQILQQVFVLSIPRFPLDGLQGDTSEDPFDEHEPHPSYTRSTLRCVSRRWKNVLDATPKAWSTIALDNRLPHDASVIERWLSRSENEQIDVYIQPSAWSESLDAARFQTVLALIRGHLPRMRSFIAHLRHYRALVDLTLTLTDIFPINRCTEAPTMEVFGIIGDLDTDPHEIVGTIRAPNLSSLVLQDSETTMRSFTRDSLLSLHTLSVSLSISPSASYLDILAHCPNLRRLNWTDYSDTRRHSTIKLPDVSALEAPLLPLLTSLTLRIEVSAETLPLFKHLRSSILDTISVDASPATDSRPSPLDALISLLRPDMTPHLRHLMLTRATVGPGIANLFPSLPNLTTLHLSACHIEAPFFSKLVRQEETTSLVPACPRLVTLCLSSSYFRVSDLAYFLRYHAESNNAEPLRPSIGCLMCVEIVGCENMLEENDRGEALLLEQEYRHIMSYS